MFRLGNACFLSSVSAGFWLSQVLVREVCTFSKVLGLSLEALEGCLGLWAACHSFFSKIALRRTMTTASQDLGLWACGGQALANQLPQRGFSSSSSLSRSLPWSVATWAQELSCLDPSALVQGLVCSAVNVEKFPEQRYQFSIKPIEKTSDGFFWRFWWWIVRSHWLKALAFGSSRSKANHCICIQARTLAWGIARRVRRLLLALSWRF